MSYSTMIYAVDLDRLRKTVGSRKGSLIRKLKRRVDDDADDDEISVAQAVEELIKGSFTAPGSAHQYGYALEHVCGHLGTCLDSNSVGDVSELELNTPLADLRHPVALPEIADFPFISSLSKDAVDAEVERLGSMELSFPDDEEIEEARRELFECLRQAAARRLGVVTFYY